MRVSLSASLLAVVAVLATTGLTACGSVTAPGTEDPPAIPSATARSGPPAGSRPEAAALARLLLSRLVLPSGARRLPQTPLPSSLIQPFYGPGDVSSSLDQYRLFALTQPMGDAAAFLAAHVPAGLAENGEGQGSGPAGVTMREVTYLAQHVPAGIAAAQLVVTLAPASSGGSLLRADAQVTWYPSRTAAEYIDPARYHVLSIRVFVAGRHPHIVHQVVTSQAFIARLATALNRMQAEVLEAVHCPAIFADYTLSFSVSRSSRPVVVVTANETGCGGAGITVNGQQQPPLVDQNGTVASLVDQVVNVNWEL